MVYENIFGVAQNLFGTSLVRLTLYSLAVISSTTGFNIKNVYMVLTFSLNVLYRFLPRKTLTDCSSVTDVQSVYRAVRTESLYKT